MSNVKGNILKFGFAQNKITPVLNGIFLDGYGFRLTPATGIRDDLYVKVCAIQCAEERFIIVSFDLIGLRSEIYRLISDQITAVTGITRERMALCCSHTHSAPSSGCLEQLPVHYDYLAHVGDICGLTALTALERAVPCDICATIVPEKLVHTFNRRGRDMIDRNIRAASFIDETGKVRGVICSAACHPVLNTTMAVSADYLSVLNSISTDDLPYLFLAGRGADIDPSRDKDFDLDALIDRLGHELSDPVAKAAQAAANKYQAPIFGMMEHRYEFVRMPIKPYPGEADLIKKIDELKNSYSSLEYGSTEKHFALRELEWTRMILDRVRKMASAEMTIPLQLFRCEKKFVFAFVPFELFTLTGNRLENYFLDTGFSRESIFIIGYANSYNGYLVPAEEFPFGGYETSDAAHWVGTGEFSELSESTIVQWFEKA